MLRRLLRLPIFYRALSGCLNAQKAHRLLVALAGYQPGTRTLDIGCGPGDLANYFDPRDYVGIDLSEAYIEDARRNMRGTFHVLPAERIGELPDTFDLVVMCGVFHHLSDEAVRATLAGLTRILKPAGRFVLLEAVWPSSAWDLPGYLMRKLDRGGHIRTRSEWERLLGECWNLEQPSLFRNGIVEYFGCTLRPRASATRQNKSSTPGSEVQAA